MKTLFRPYLAFILMGSLLTATACKDDEDPKPDEERELITTVTLRLEPVDAGKAQTVTATWKDLDGPGGQAPTISSLTLKPNTDYTGTLTFLDESKTGQTHDITAEINEEADDHEVFYVATPADLLEIQKTDRDSKNRTLGLRTTIATRENTGAGTLRIVLKHQPSLKSSGSNMNTGETDADITFETIVQE